MKRWNWWLAWRVLRGRIVQVSYRRYPEHIVVEMDVDDDVRRHHEALSAS